MKQSSKSWAIVIPALFILITLISWASQTEATEQDFLLERYWEKYELDGTRTDVNNEIVLEFFPMHQKMDFWNIYYSIRTPDTILLKLHAAVFGEMIIFENQRDSIYVFFDDLNWAYGWLHGENDILINKAYGIRTYVEWESSIYLKKRIPVS